MSDGVRWCSKPVAFDQAKEDCIINASDDGVTLSELGFKGVTPGERQIKDL